MQRDAECSTCLTVKPIVYASVYVLPGMRVTLPECSACRMATHRHPIWPGEEYVTPAYIWDHLPRVRAAETWCVLSKCDHRN